MGGREAGIGDFWIGVQLSLYVRVGVECLGVWLEVGWAVLSALSLLSSFI